MKKRFLRWILLGLLAGERVWACVLAIVAVAAAALVPMALAGWVNPVVALVLSWITAMVCAFAAHIYRGRAMLWEALCRKARREANEFFEGLLEGKPQVIEVAVQQGGRERMPN